MARHRTPPVDGEQLLRLVLDFAADYAVFLLDPAGRVTGWNASAERLLGYAEPEIRRQPFSRFFTPEDVTRGEPERQLQQAQAEGRSAGERWMIRKDGTCLWAVGLLAARRDARGRLTGYVQAVRDRTEERLTEDILQKRERRFRALIEHGWDAVALLSGDGTVLYASPSTARVLGHAPEEFVGRNALELVHPDDLPRISQLFAQLIAQPRLTLHSTFRYRHGDGGWRWLEGVGNNLLDEPSVRAIAANFRDITQQREDEQIRSQLAAVVESSEDAIIVKDLDGMIVSWNKAAERLFGYKAEEVIGKPLALLVPPGQPDEIPGIMERLQRGEVIEHYETVRVRKDGSLVEVSLSISPVKDAEGRVVGAAKIARDTTARRKAERRQRLLAESGAVLAASLDERPILEAVARLVVPALADYCVIHLREEGDEVVQAAAAHIDPGKEALLQELAGVYHPGDYPDSPVNQVLRSGQSELVPDYPRAVADAVGPCAPVLELLRQLGPRSGILVPLSARGRTLGTIALLAAESGRRYDDSDREFAEELARRVALAVDNARLYREVREADRRKGEWIALLAHELRNPLAPLLTGLHVLRRWGGDRAAFEQAGLMMERQVRHLARLVDDLLDASRVAGSKVSLRRERLDLARLVRTTAADRGSALADAGLTYTVQTPDTPVWMSGDATRLAQVLSNLLDNAVKFTDRGGNVTVKLTTVEGGGVAELSVRDTGVGIDPEVLPRLFEPFSQADRSLHRTQGGLGLGLALVRGLTELHGGTVRATSAGPGRGAEFVVRLPLEAEPPVLAQATAEPRPAAVRRSVLVIEDNRDSADTLRMLLELMGHDVRVAYTGPEGVRLAREWRPAVVLSDIGLPGLDGFGVARAIRSDPATAGVRLIAVSGYGADEDRRLAHESGFEHLLTKPADPAVLQDLLAAE